MLHTDLLRFLRFDGRRNVGERPLCSGTVLVGRQQEQTKQKGQLVAKPGRNVMSNHTHITNLLHRKVRIRWDPRVASPTVCSYIHDHHHRPRREPFEQLSNLEIGRTQSRSGVVKPYRSFFRYGTSSKSA